MYHAYIIEVGEEAVGVVARDACGYRFYAAKNSFRSLEGRIFRSAESARSAALDLHRRAAATPSALTSLRTRADANERRFDSFRPRQNAATLNDHQAVERDNPSRMAARMP